jgi:two-component system phosphate regulon sensor histidine kinase PhoR
MIISIERERARHKISVLEELNNLKSEFISNVSHELRTPLASIVGFAETIMSDHELSKETIHEFSEIILNEGKRLAKLIDNLLDFSRLESGQDDLQKTDIGIIKVIEEVLLSFSQQIKEKNLTLSKLFPEEDPIIKADKERIEKVFWNLIANSIKFTNPGGRISLIIQDFEKEVEIVISDTGIGISEKDLPYLFQKFSKVQRPGAQIGGTGFGLVTVKQIVDLHKGFIKVRSELDKGTSFLIRLPK